MQKTYVKIEKDMRIAETDDRLYSSFIEHLGRAVYTGIYEPDHPSADGQGFRTDVIALVQELGVDLVRYPGGNFVSGYDWKDGIGPRSSRPRRLDLAWHSIESNQVGIDDFFDWTVKSGTRIMGAVNMGTGTPKEAGELVEYCNFPGGTYWSDLRTENGHKTPYGIKTWCIGNEMDGPWQICHLEAPEYGKKARETAKIIKWIDPATELVVCGSASSVMPTYPEWDRTVLEYTYEYVDYLSLHRYYENLGNDTDFLASFVDMDRFIKTVTATVDYVKALKRSKKTVNLSFDEWNVWYQRNQKEHEWMEAPEILEDQYSLLDALVFAGMGMTLVNNADRVKIACLAQLVNVIAPIFTRKGGAVIRQATFYPFRDLSLHARGTVLRPLINSETVDSCYGAAPVISAAAVVNRKGTELSVFCLNIGKSDIPDFSLDLSSFGSVTMQLWSELSGSTVLLKNTFEAPDAVVPHRNPCIPGKDGLFTLNIKARSWNTFVFNL
jgi:alpha-N-arabinofuranosidase